eukprot:5452285-Karenia_brevis.AAC.1
MAQDSPNMIQNSHHLVPKGGGVKKLEKLKENIDSLMFFNMFNVSFQDGSTWLQDGSTELPDGSKVLQDGSKMTQGGSKM